MCSVSMTSLSTALRILIISTTLCYARESGIYIRLNQKAVNYISDLASSVTPQLLNNLHLPNPPAGPAKITELVVHEVRQPNISATFLDKKGVHAAISFPYIKASAHADVNLVLWMYDGNFEVEINNLNIDLRLNFTRNETAQFVLVQAEKCEVTESEIKFNIDASSSLNGIRDEMKDAVIDGIRGGICGTALDAIRYIGQQNVQESVQTTEEPFAPEDPSSFNAAQIGASLCARMDVDSSEGEDEMTTTEEPKSNGTQNSWSADLSISYGPNFTDEEVVIGLDGGLLLNGMEATEVYSPQALNTSHLDERMVGILISEYVANTMFAHVFDGDLGTVHQRFTAEQLPKSFRKIGRMLCAKCYLDITAELSKRPLVEIDETRGARIALSGNVSILFHGRQELHDVIHATSDMTITVKPTIRHSRVYGDVSLSHVDVNVLNLGVGGAMSGPLEKLLSFAVPRAVWPQLKKRLRFALNRRGFQLPVICGVEFQHMKLDYADHAVVLNTDFTFDLPLFVEKFKMYVTKRAETFNVYPRYLVDNV